MAAKSTLKKRYNKQQQSHISTASILISPEPAELGVVKSRQTRTGRTTKVPQPFSYKSK
jgi:hypothetical protein